jgi:hypothetical protein
VVLEGTGVTLELGVGVVLPLEVEHGFVLATTDAVFEVLPARSYAITVSVYAVPHLRRLTRYEVDLVLPTRAPLRYTR